MSHAKADTRTHYPSDLIDHLITKRAPIHTYNYSKANRDIKPYISFLFIDTDTLPSVINIPLDLSDPLTCFIDAATRQPALHIHYRGDSRPGNNSQIPSIQTFTLDAQAISVEAPIPFGNKHESLGATLNLKNRQEKSIVQSLTFAAQSGSEEVSISIGKQHVSLDAALKPKDRRETLLVQSHQLDAQATAVEKNICCTTLNPFLDGTFDPIDQQTKLTLLSLKQDERANSIEETIVTVEQKTSLQADFELGMHTGIPTIPYILNDKSVLYTNVATRKEHQCESYNHSLAVIEPRCCNYLVSKTRPISRIVRYHRYSRASRISSSDKGADFKS